MTLEPKGGGCHAHQPTLHARAPAPKEGFLGETVDVRALSRRMKG